jgi:polysaccharide deacetylase family protein (PEP-CTERM system associated)
MVNCLTVDVEEWFHVCENTGPFSVAHWDELPSRVVDTTRDLLCLLDSCSVRSTFFVLGWVAARCPHLITEIAQAGHEIASHGYGHQPVYELTPADFERDLDASRAALADAGVPPARGYRAPLWSLNDRSLWALDVLARRGFEFDSSMVPLPLIGNAAYPRQPHRRETSSGGLTEFPPLVTRRFGYNFPLGLGWGLRMSSSKTVLRGIEAANKCGIPAAIAMHPWEIDPTPPRMKLPVAKNFAHYFRLHGFRARLEQTLKGASFAPMGEVLETLAAST